MKKVMVVTLMGCLAAILVLADSFGGPPPPVGPSLPKIKPKRVEEMKKHIKPKPRVGLIRISGHVTVPDGRGLGNVKVKLYEILDSGFRYVGDVTTTKAGFYSIALGGEWFNKKVRLVPKHPAFREGEHFSVREYRFQITSDKMTNRNFRYTGPLPDLQVLPLATHFSRGGLIVAVVNIGEVESGPFKVRIRLRRDSPLSLMGKIVDFPSISPRDWAEKEIPDVDPDTDHLLNIIVDIRDEVIESNENNNVSP